MPIRPSRTFDLSSALYHPPLLPLNFKDCSAISAVRAETCAHRTTCVSTPNHCRCADLHNYGRRADSDFSLIRQRNWSRHDNAPLCAKIQLANTPGIVCYLSGYANRQLDPDFESRTSTPRAARSFRISSERTKFLAARASIRSARSACISLGVHGCALRMCAIILRP